MNETMCGRDVRAQPATGERGRVEHGETTGVLNGFPSSAATQALASVAPVLETLSGEEVRRFCVAAGWAVRNGLRVGRAFERDEAAFGAVFSERMLHELGSVSVVTRALAFWEADMRHRDAIEVRSGEESAADRGRALRAKLLKAASYVWGDDEELGALVADIRSSRGTADLADDLDRLCTLFTNRWDDARGQCAVTEEDLIEGSRLGSAVMGELAVPCQDELAALKLTRDRAAEYLRRGVDDVRQAAAFVFRRDPEQLERYPSLFEGGGRGRPARNGVADDGAEQGHDLPDDLLASSEEVSEPRPEPFALQAEGTEPSADLATTPTGAG